MRGAGSIIVNDQLVTRVLDEEGTDLAVLYSNLELGVRYVSSFHAYLKYI